MSQAAPSLDLFNQIAKKMTVHYLDRARAYPFLKWAGGKRALVPEIVKLLPEHFGNYYEPFCGGGAVFFALDSRIRQAYLSDVNTELMLTYAMLRKNAAAVVDLLKEHAQKHGAEHYKQIRSEGHNYRSPVKIAARFIYLNKTCYNGLYRVNKSGQFNVPMGNYKNPAICDEDNLLAAGEVLEKAALKTQSFEKIAPSKDDFVYCDPPYDETYQGYTENGFGLEGQTALRDAATEWHKNGVRFVISSSDTELIRKLYQSKTFRLVRIEAPRSISCKAKERERVVELLITGA